MSLTFQFSRILEQFLERKYNPVRKERHRNQNELRRKHFPKNLQKYKTSLVWNLSYSKPKFRHLEEKRRYKNNERIKPILRTRCCSRLTILQHRLILLNPNEKLRSRR